MRGISLVCPPILKERDKGNLENYGAAPTNFQIDKVGRIVFSDFTIGAENETHLKMMIDLLLGAPAGFLTGEK